VAALSAAGLPTDAFCFEGFLPSRRQPRLDRLHALRRVGRTLIFYESVHRITAFLADLESAFGGSRRAFIGRELSKLHEQCVAGTLTDLGAMLGDGRIPRKGEFVVVTEGVDPGDGGTEDPGSAALDVDRLLTELLRVVSGKKAVEIAAAATGQSRNVLYRRMLSLAAPRK
jgi:16S rRNA (cytidine1402-2'-O)-methyltransferase